jgi:RNA polymerase sigma-70 factor, ECF subfamily
MSLPSPDRALSLPSLWKSKQECAAPERVVERPAEVSDEDLLLRLREKDREALALLVDRYARKVRSVARRVLHDQGEADDMVQTVFLYLFQKAHVFDPTKGTAKTWITQVAYRRALDRRNYLVHRQFYVGTDLSIPADTLAGEADVEQAVGSMLDREQIMTALEELPEAQRMTLILSFFEGLNPNEISERLGVSVGNVRHYYYRGLARMRRNPAVRRLWGTP